MWERAHADKLFFVVLMLNATGVFRFLAPPLDMLTPRLSVDIGDVTAVLFLLNVCYLAIRAEYLVPLFRGGLGAWLLVLVFWPVLTAVYSPAVGLREFGLILYFFSLMSASAVYTLANGLPAFYRLMSVSLVVTAVGLVLSVIAPQYFETVAELADSRAEYHGRSFGFFMQPNRAACALGFLFIGWFALCRFRNTRREAMAILVFLVMMLLTGSRSGALLAGFIVTLIIVHSWRQSHADGGYVLKVATIVLCLVGMQIGMHYYASRRDNSVGRTDADLITRMTLLLSLKLSTAGSVTDDTSVRERFDAQTVYWDLIAERPVLGHGFGAEIFYMANGPLFLTAHSGAITSAMEYGIFYPLVFWWLVLRFYGKRSRGAIESALGTNSILQCVFGALFMFTINGGLLQARTFYVVWGMFFAVVNCPEYVFGDRTPAEKAKRREGKSDVHRVGYYGKRPDGCAIAKQNISAPLTRRESEV